MKTRLTHVGLGIASILTVTSLAVAPVAAQQNGGVPDGDAPVPTTTSATPTSSTSGKRLDSAKSALSSAEKSRIDSIRKRSSNEVSRRVNSLNGLIKKVNAAQYLTDAQKASLVAELNTQIGGLQSVNTEVQGDSDVTSAKDDAQKIITDYHVYAFIVPKVQIILTADRQQVLEAKLSDATAKLQTAIDTAKAGGKDVTALQAKLDDMQAKLTSAQTTSSSVESSALALQSTGSIDTDRTALKGLRDQLKTARTAIGAALNDARAIVNGLK